MQPILHFTPAKGWLNDPNGLIQYRGIHHLFFQHNPHLLAMKDMVWGHATSTDLLTWTEHPVALVPGPEGSYDDGGCWSGCAVHSTDGIAIIYSGNHAGIQLPCLARPMDDDLIVWEKAAANPVIPHRPPVDGITDMRDHSVRWDGRQWQQVLAGGVDGVGVLFGYASPDLVNWSFNGIVLRAGEGDLPGHVWECPDVFVVGDQVVAIMSVMDVRRSVIWVTGTLDGAQIRPERWGAVDYGDRFYAPQSYSDQSGRRIMFGWLATQADAAALGQANIGVASLPRVLTVVDGRLHQAPAVELEGRRGQPAEFTLAHDSTFLAMPVPLTTALELRLTSEYLLDLSVELHDDAGHLMTFDLATFSSDHLPGRDGVAPPGAGARVIFDNGIVEVFLDDGRAAAVSDARLEAVGGVVVSKTRDAPVDVVLWPLAPVAG
jgi:beta-fructofuranosidase